MNVRLKADLVILDKIFTLCAIIVTKDKETPESKAHHSETHSCDVSINNFMAEFGRKQHFTFHEVIKYKLLQISLKDHYVQQAQESILPKYS